jgi:hypothetical protein
MINCFLYKEFLQIGYSGFQITNVAMHEPIKRGGADDETDRRAVGSCFMKTVR